MPHLSSNKIYSQSAKQFWVAWVGAIIWNAVTWFAIIKGGNNILRAFDENPIFYFFVLFPFIGIGVVISAIRQTLAWYKFGKTPVTLSPLPGQVGGHCAGYIGFPISEKGAKHAQLSLSCIRSYITRDSQGRSSQREKAVWQDRITLKPEKYGRKKMRLNFVFNPPAHLPATEPESDDYHLWRLHIKIPLPGIDFDRIFELPMEKATGQSIVTHQHNTLQSSEVVERQDTELGLIPKLRKTASGSQFYYGYGRSKGMAIALVTFGLFIAVFGHFFFDGFLDFLPATTGLMAIYVGLLALALFLLGLFLISNSLTVEVSLKGVRKQQRFFGYLREELIATNDIADIVVEQNGSSTSGNTTRVWYRLKLLRRDGSHIEVGDSLEGQSYADEIKQQMIIALGSSWQVGTVGIAKEMAKRPIPSWLRWLGKLLSYSFFIALLYDLNKMFPEMTEFLTQLWG